jgi:hypothetical protein
MIAKEEDIELGNRDDAPGRLHKNRREDMTDEADDPRVTLRVNSATVGIVDALKISHQRRLDITFALNEEASCCRQR